MAKQDPLHVVVVSSSFMGHCRSLCTFVASLLIVPTTVVVTVIIPDSEGLIEKVEKEISKGLNVFRKTEGSNVRIATLPTVEEEQGFSVDVFGTTWSKLAASEPIMCESTGRIVPATFKPAAAVCDIMFYPLFDVIRSSQAVCPIFSYWSGFVGAQIWLSAPKSMGGREGALPPTSAPSHCCHNAVNIRSLPPISCESLVPFNKRESGIPPTLQRLMRGLIRSEEQCDAYLCISSEAYEGKEMMEATQDMVSRNGYRPVFNLGCMMPIGYGTEKANNSITAIETTGQREPALCFLDRSQKRHGRRSVVYISFGTVFATPSVRHVLILLRALQQRRIPFVFTTALGTTDTDEESELEATFVAEYSLLRAECEADDMGFFTSWAPQQSVLAHASLGWFVSHGGNNSTAEALVQGVPIIGWALSFDQPLNVAHLVHTLDVAFEVTTWNLGICSWGDWSPTCKVNDTAMGLEITMILDALNTDVGMRKRANAVRVGEKLRTECMEVGGRAYWEKDRFLQYCRTFQKHGPSCDMLQNETNGTNGAIPT